MGALTIHSSRSRFAAHLRASLRDRHKDVDMLVITRTLGDAMRIGDEIVVVVAEIRSDAGQVRLGIEAPREVKVLRAELTEDSKGVTV